MRWRRKLQFKFAELYVNTLSRVELVVHGVSLNPFSKDLWFDPYAHHSKMRDTRPIHYSMALKAYWVTPFELVQEILRDKRFGSDVRQHEKRVARLTKNMDTERLKTFSNPSMLDLDPPNHSRVRRLVTQGFMHKFIQSLEPRIREIVAECLDAQDNDGQNEQPTIDIVARLAKPLPAIVIAEMLG